MHRPEVEEQRHIHEYYITDGDMEVATGYWSSVERGRS